MEILIPALALTLAGSINVAAVSAAAVISAILALKKEKQKEAK